MLTQINWQFRKGSFLFQTTTTAISVFKKLHLGKFMPSLRHPGGRPQWRSLVICVTDKVHFFLFLLRLFCRFFFCFGCIRGYYPRQEEEVQVWREIKQNKLAILFFPRLINNIDFHIETSATIVQLEISTIVQLYAFQQIQHQHFMQF